MAGIAANDDVDPDAAYADLPRLELEQLLGELTGPTQDVRGAQDLRSAQGRLRGLLNANNAIVGDLSLPVMLRCVVAAAMGLVDASAAALGLIGNDGRLEEFVHSGMDEDTVRQLGALPHDRWPLGFLIDHPTSVGMAHLRAQPIAAPFPVHRPPTRSCLGVPIQVGDDQFGNLYLTDSAKGEFTLEDEQLVTALAATAGVAIANARLFREFQKQRQWLTASSEFTQELFAGSVERPADSILRYAISGADADLATLTIAISDTQGRVHAAGGAVAEMTGVVVDLDRTLAGQVIQSGKPVLITDYAAEFGMNAVGEPPVAIGAAISAPLLGANARVLSALTVARLTGRPAFTENDRDQLTGFANHAGLALELERSRGEREALRETEDHARIAADLHDHVIQELFATGMGLEGMIKGLDRREQQIRVIGYVEALDATIRRIRSTIFALQPAQHVQGSFQQRLLALLDEHTAALGFAPGIEFSGPLDLAVSASLADDALAVVREALSNTARHAHASRVEVTIRVSGSVLALEVSDDGEGIGTSTRSSGLANLRRRAEARAGTCALAVPAGGGTHLRWTATLA